MFSATTSEDIRRVKALPDHRKPTVVIQQAGMLRSLGLSVAWEYRELLYFFVWRDIKVRYRQTVIGVAWVVLQPLVTTAIFTAVFAYMARMPSDGQPYPLFVLAAILPWTYFSTAVSKASLSVVANGNLLTKVFFPRMLVPLGAVVTPTIDMLASLPLLAFLMAWYGVVPGWSVLAFPFLIALIVLTAFAFSLVLSAMHVRYRDVGQAIPFAIQIWMYLSPVVYSLSAVPEAWRAAYMLNPMVGIIAGFRWAVLGAGSGPAPFIEMAVAVAVVLGLLTAALAYFRHMERTFADIV